MRTAIVAVLAAMLALGAARAFAHAFLDHASPAVGSRIRGAPASVTLWFTENLEPAFSTLTVVDAHGTQVDRGDARVDAADRRSMRVNLTPLAAGTYRVVWHVLSVDAHASDGDFAFTVVP